jgi:hypothetical protein
MNVLHNTSVFFYVSIIYLSRIYNKSKGCRAFFHYVILDSICNKEESQYDYNEHRTLLNEIQNVHIA